MTKPQLHLTTAHQFQAIEVRRELTAISKWNEQKRREDLWGVAADADVAETYEHFCTLREQRIIAEIRKVCGIRAMTLDLGS
jgi:hypothetical protein